MELLGAYVRRKRFEASLFWPASRVRDANERTQASLSDLSSMGFGIRA